MTFLPNLNEIEMTIGQNNKGAMFSDMFLFIFRQHNTNVLTLEEFNIWWNNTDENLLFWPIVIFLKNKIKKNSKW